MTAPSGWTFSSNEEHWSNDTDFATREEAIAEAVGVLGLAEGDRFWTGRAVPVEARELAEANDWGSMIAEQIDQHLYDNVGEVAEDGIEATTAQIKELHTAVALVIQGWLDKHLLTPSCYQLEEVKSHVHRPEDVDPSDIDAPQIGGAP